MKNYVYASYVPEPALHNLRVYDLLRMTHLNYSFAHVKDSKVSVDHLLFLDKLPILKGISPELKIIISIGGWGADGFSQAAMTAEGRKSFADTAAEIVKKYDFDGIDIDWEYPTSDLAGIAHSPKDKENYTLLFKVLREALTSLGKETGKSYELTCAVGGDKYFIDGSEMDKVSQYVDYVFIMSYDLRGGFTDIAGHHTNLYPQKGDENGPSTARAVELYMAAGVPKEKIVIGSAFYPRQWGGLQSDVDGGLGQKASTKGVIRTSFDVFDEEQQKLHGFKKYWDDQAKAAYLFNGENFISFEDEQSLKLKCDYVKEKDLAGLMYWAYGNHKLFEIPAHELLGFPEIPKIDF